MRYVASALLRLIIFAAVWAGFTGAKTDYIWYGLLSVSLATALSLVLVPPRDFSLLRLPALVWHGLVLGLWFIKKSIVGGIDVALRSLSRPLRIDPVVVSARIELPEGAARHIALILMSLMPGTMVQRLLTEDGTLAHARGTEPTHVELHAIAAELDPEQQWLELQRRCQKLVP